MDVTIYHIIHLELKELVDKHRTFDEENEEPLTMDEALIIKVCFYDENYSILMVTASLTTLIASQAKYFQNSPVDIFIHILQIILQNLHGMFFTLVRNMIS